MISRTLVVLLFFAVLSYAFAQAPPRTSGSANESGAKTEGTENSEATGQSQKEKAAPEPAKGQKGKSTRTEKKSKEEKVSKEMKAAKEATTEEKEGESTDPLSSGTFGGLKFRCVGPALISGRVVSIAVNPQNKAQYYIGVASGGVWRTDNHGTTFESFRLSRILQSLAVGNPDSSQPFQPPSMDSTLL